MIISGLRSAARTLPPSSQLCTATRAVILPPTSTPLCHASRRGHQRRPSSSKASCPPGDQSDNPRATPAAATAAAAPKTTTGAVAEEAVPTTAGVEGAATEDTKSSGAAAAAGRNQGSRSTRTRKQKSTAWAASARDGQSVRTENWTERFPSVPSTSGYSEADVGLSTLFALHRPLALAAPLPPPVPQQAFEKIFQTTPPPSTNRRGTSAADVVATLNSTITALEGAATPRGRQPGLRWNAVQEAHASQDAMTRHLDGRPPTRRNPANVDEFVAGLKPYTPPPPPSPITAATHHRNRRGSNADAATSSRSNPPPRDYRATVVLREVQGEDYMVGEMESLEPIPPPPSSSSSSSSQMRSRASHSRTRSPSQIMTQRGPPQGQERQAVTGHKRMGMTFAKWARMRKVLRLRAGIVDAPPLVRRYHLVGGGRAGGAGRRGVLLARGPGTTAMHAISVRRLRKLKMKKHKYKKLMKRTRNLRRRLDK